MKKLFNKISKTDLHKIKLLEKENTKLKKQINEIEKSENIYSFELYENNELFRLLVNQLRYNVEKISELKKDRAFYNYYHNRIMAMNDEIDRILKANHVETVFEIKNDRIDFLISSIGYYAKKIQKMER